MFGKFILDYGDKLYPIRTEMFEVDPGIVFEILNNPDAELKEDWPAVYKSLHEWYGRGAIRSMSVGDSIAMETDTQMFVWRCEPIGWTHFHHTKDNS